MGGKKGQGSNGLGKALIKKH